MDTQAIIKKCKELTAGGMPLPGNPVEKERLDEIKKLYKTLFGTDLCEGCGGKFENGYKKLQQIGQGILNLDGTAKNLKVTEPSLQRTPINPKKMNIKKLSAALLAYAEKHKASQVVHLNAGKGELTKHLAEKLPFISVERNKIVYEESFDKLKEHQGRAFWGEPFGVLNRALLGAYKSGGIEVKNDAFFVFDAAEGETDNFVKEIDQLYRFNTIVRKPSLAVINLKGEYKDTVEKHLKLIYGEGAYETETKEVEGVTVFFAGLKTEQKTVEEQPVKEAKPKGRKAKVKAEA